MEYFRFHKLSYLATLLIMLLGTQLSACIPIPLVSVNQAPDPVPHILGDIRTSDAEVLVLTMSDSVNMSGDLSGGVFGSRRTDRKIDSPVFVKERDLERIVGFELSRARFGMALLGDHGFAIGFYGKASVIEACLVFPDGRLVALSVRGKKRWLQETRGSVTSAWRGEMLGQITGATALMRSQLYGVCPSTNVTLEWTSDERRSVINFLSKIDVRQGAGGELVTDHMTWIPRRVIGIASYLSLDPGDTGDFEWLLLTVWRLQVTDPGAPEKTRTVPISGAPTFLRGRDLPRLDERLRQQRRGVAVRGHLDVPEEHEIAELTLSTLCLIRADGEFLSLRSDRNLSRDNKRGRIKRDWQTPIYGMLTFSKAISDVDESAEGKCLLPPEGDWFPGEWTEEERERVAAFLARIPERRE